MISKERFDAVVKEEGLGEDVAGAMWFMANLPGVDVSDGDDEGALREAVKYYLQREKEGEL